MKELNLTVEKRDETGKGPNRRIRRAGDVPAIVYGPETEPIPVQINYQHLYRMMHGVPLTTIINLDIKGLDAPSRKVIIRELQKDPVTGRLVHIDFHHIPMDKPISVTVPIKTVGIPLGVKSFGGIVEHITRDIEISCLPSDIPDEIEIDISNLSIGESLHVSDLAVQKVTVLSHPGTTLITVVAPTVVKSAAETAAEEAAAAPPEGEEAAEGEAEEEEGGEKKAGEKKAGEKKAGEKKTGDKKEKEGGDEKERK
jgi:large subunit ribosomal protein L25